MHTPVVRSKLIAYGLYDDEALVGGMLWASTPFTKKAGLIGRRQPYDKWEVLVLARLYLDEAVDVYTTWFLAEALGRAGRHNMSKRRGWRLQDDWVAKYPPKFPQNPFVPRLLISWSDGGLKPCKDCTYCHKSHNGRHTGTIYAASGWELWDTTSNNARRMGVGPTHYKRERGGLKACWLLRLAPRPRAHAAGLALYKEQHDAVPLSGR